MLCPACKVHKHWLPAPALAGAKVRTRGRDAVFGAGQQALWGAAGNVIEGAAFAVGSSAAAILLFPAVLRRQADCHPKLTAKSGCRKGLPQMEMRGCVLGNMK